MQAVTGFLKENALFIGVLAVMAVAYLLLRQGPSSVSSAAEFDAALGTGKPVLVEFYSDR
ncbi:MAG: hypothetical protein M0Z94_09090 [Dehalococcoidales bacterium]|nr:hypothetical protein [Dehalococcoidales bacterium]